jgi:hypothetical protein
VRGLPKGWPLTDFLSCPKSAENENPELVDRDDENPF